MPAIFISHPLQNLLRIIRKVNVWQCQTLNSFCFRRLCPLDPQRGSAPVPCWGHQLPLDPSLVWVPSAHIAVYFQNITVSFKSYLLPCKDKLTLVGCIGQPSVSQVSIEGVEQHLTVNSFNTHVPKIQGGIEAPSYNFLARLFSINMQIKSHMYLRVFC